MSTKQEKHSDKKKKLKVKEPQEAKSESEQEEVKEVSKPEKGEKAEVQRECQVFISGIPYECSEEEIKDFFSDIKDQIKEVKLPRWQDSGKCRGYAHLVLKSESAKVKALAKNKEKLKGRYLDIAEAQGSKAATGDKRIQETNTIATAMPSDCTTIFVKNLPYDFKEDDIGDRFRKFGEIKNIRLSYNWQTKVFKGFAYVQYASHDSAKKALVTMNGKEIKGRSIKVDFDVQQKAKKGYKLNLETEKNKLYNKEIVREEVKKRKRKENEKKRDGIDKASRN